MNDLLTIYLQYIRPTLEYASPVWFCGLTKLQGKCLEKLQRKAFRIIFTIDYCKARSYSDICELHNIPALLHRLESLSLSFGKSLLESKTHRGWLPPLRNNSLRNANKLTSIRCRTNRYKCSAIPFLTSILNK